MKEIDALVLADIRSMAALVVEDEDSARKRFLSEKAQINSRQKAEEQKRLRAVRSEVRRGRC